MQRRLAVALVLTALVSVLLVGFGILAIAQLGARDRAADRVERGLSVLASVLESDNGTRLRQAIPAIGPQSRRDLGLDVLEAVRIADDGGVEPLGFRRPGPGGGLRGLPDVRLSDGQRADLEDGETVLVSQGDTVIGVRLLPPTGEVAADGSPLRIGLLAAEPVSAIPRQTVTWFVLSSAVVLAGALAAGVLLARRLVHPIRDIQGATAAIAAGQLTARVEAEGDDELAELGRSVNRMAADLERSKALDQQFLLSVSHDLRTPLTAISGYAEALRDGAAEPATAGEVIGNHAARLDRLVGDLLDLAKLDANRFRLDLRPTDLAVVAGRTAAGLAPEAAQHGVTVEHRADGPAPVLADADRMAQAIGNIVANAVTFARERVVVEVAVTSEGEDDARAVVAVIDDGPGFQPEDLPFVFDRLYTGQDQPRRAENPTGLGLAIVRELAAAMGGTVEAANQPDAGARIALSFPVLTAGPGPDPTRGPVTADEPETVSPPAERPRPEPTGPPDPS